MSRVTHSWPGLPMVRWRWMAALIPVKMFMFRLSGAEVRWRWMAAPLSRNINILTGIRAAIHRHLTCAPLSRNINILTGIRAAIHRHLTRSPQNADHADCRLQTADRADCADRADRADWVLFFLSLFLHSLLTGIFFRSGHKLVVNYISECLFMKRPFYVTLAWYVQGVTNR